MPMKVYGFAGRTKLPRGPRAAGWKALFYMYINSLASPPPHLTDLYCELQWKRPTWISELSVILAYYFCFTPDGNKKLGRGF